MSQNILVTGGAGFIGSHMVERFLERGDSVWVVDDLSTGRLANLEGVREHPSLHLVVDSIMNYPMMAGVVGQCDLVVHLAAAVGVKKIMDEPVGTITTNVRGTEIVLELAAKRKTPVFLASTSEIYGKAGSKLHEEHDRVMGSTTKRRWAYAATKVLDEFLALAYFDELELPVVIGRFFNTVGPRQTGAWGMVVPTFVQAALRNEPIPVHGTGDQMRSFCHVFDTIRAVEGLCERPDAAGRVFNIGREEEISILALAERIRDRLGSTSEIRRIPYTEVYGARFEDMERRQPDITRIRDFLGWAPELELDRMIDDVAAEIRARDA